MLLVPLLLFTNQFTINQTYLGKENEMQAKQVLAKNESYPAQKNAQPLVVSEETLFDRMQDIYRQIENRAYQLFEERGRQPGFDLDDWFRAETELLTNMPIHVSDNPTQVMVHVEIPDFSEKEIQINVQPQRLLLSGRKEIKSVSDDESIRELQVKQFFRSLPLPSEVKTDGIKTEFKDGSLDITLPKMNVEEKT